MAPAAPQTATVPRKAWSVLIVSTLAFTTCFMVWMMFGVIGIPLKQTPVLTGSLNRVPLGILTKFGRRIVLACQGI